MAKTIIGVMGAGNLATAQDLELAYLLGQAIAKNNWILLTGGRNVGVMDAASRGAKANDGLVVGILPGKDKTSMSEAVDIAIVTDLGNARNNINVLSADVIITCGIGLGTASEIALALKNNKPVILLQPTELTYEFFASLTDKFLFSAETVEKAIALIQEILTNSKQT
ncbi:MAG: TIGR00725 family protein [Cyanobacteria bacterium J06621_12]